MKILNAEPQTVPSTAEYRAGLSTIHDQITDNQLRMLMAHYEAPSHAMTARQLSDVVGYASHRGTNLQYGRLAGTLAEAMGIEIDGDLVFLLATFRREGDVAKGEVQLVMRPELVSAIHDLGWFSTK